jgi:hypothetical protein
MEAILTAVLRFAFGAALRALGLARTVPTLGPPRLRAINLKEIPSQFWTKLVAFLRLSSLTTRGLRPKGSAVYRVHLTVSARSFT